MVAEVFPRLPVQPEGQEIEPLYFEDSVGKVAFQPCHDITALEAALLAQFFTRMVMPRGGPVRPLAWRAHLQRLMLMRHFEPVLQGKG